MSDEVTTCNCGKDLSGLNVKNTERHLEACKRKRPFKTATTVRKKQSKISFAPAPSVVQPVQPEFDFVQERLLTPPTTATTDTEIEASTLGKDLDFEEDPLSTPTTGTLDSSSTSSQSIATNDEISTAISYSDDESLNENSNDTVLEVNYVPPPVACQGFIPDVPNFHSNFPFQLLPSVPHVTLCGTSFHTVVCSDSQFRLSNPQLTQLSVLPSRRTKGNTINNQ